MSISQEIEQVELDIDIAKKHIERYEALMNLKKNKDFKFLIEDVYFKEEASRLVLLKAAQQMESQESQLRILNQIDAIGHLQQFFMMVNSFGQQAASAMQEHVDTLQELREEA